MNRLPDWEQRLNAYLMSVAKRPFEWGRHDCALFAAGAVEALTGQYFGKAWRGRYNTAAGAQRVLMREGYDDHAGPFTAALGQPMAWALLQRGDPVVCHAGNIGVMGAGCAWFAGDSGLERLPSRLLGKGWSVGHG